MHKPILKSSFIFFALFFVYNFARAGATISGLNSGLVGYYKFEEGAGTIIHDSSGNRNNGTTTNIANPPTATSGWTNGKFGGALAFDGSDDQAGIPNSDLFKFSASSITLSVWIKTSQTSEATILLKDVQCPNTLSLSIGTVSAGTIYMGVGANGNPCSDFSNSTISVNDNKWHHVVGIRDVSDSKIYIYIDGSLNVSSSTIRNFTLTNRAHSFLIGRSFNDSVYSRKFNGSIDEVRIYNRALSADEVKRLYNMGVSKFNAPQTKKLTDGLVGYWTFDGKDIVAATALDRSGNNNNGTLTNGPKIVAGKIGQALKFNGINSYINLGTSLLSYFNSGSKNFTFSAWIKTSSENSQTILLNEALSRTPFVSFSISSKKLNLGLRDSSIVRHYVTGTKLLNDNNWHHVVGVRNGALNGNSAAIQLFVDGVSDTKSSETLDGSLANTSYGDPLTLSTSGWTTPFNGLIDEVRIYNRALSADEVKRLYNMGASKFNAPQTKRLTNGLLGYWTFDGKDIVNTGAALTVLDRSGNNNNASSTGSAIPTQSIGKLGQALKFNGSSSFITLPKNMLGTLSDFTFSAWVRPVVDATTKTIIGFPIYTTHAQYVFLGTNSGKKAEFAYRDDGVSEKSILSTNALRLNIWYHIVGVRDATNSSLRIYINGILNNSNTAATNNTITTTENSTYNLRIGNWSFSSGSEFFNGSIDEVRVYNRALSADEVKRLYNMGR